MEKNAHCCSVHCELLQSTTHVCLCVCVCACVCCAHLNRSAEERAYLSLVIYSLNLALIFTFHFICSLNIEKMPQKSITNFFKPLPEKKRKLIELKPVLVNKTFAGTDSHNDSIPTKSSVFSGDDIQKQIDFLTEKLPLLSSTFGHSWFLALKPEFSKPYFKKLNDFVVQERKLFTIYPPPDEVYSWTQFCSIDQVKIVIIGQDPYHGPKQAHGIAFSVRKGISKPPSLVNIFKEVKNCYPSFEIPDHGELIGWAKQGVLMLNACLTVRASKPASHSNQGWETLTDAVIKQINNSNHNCVFLLWGAYAQKKCSFIDKKKHLVLNSVHPSPLSAHRGYIGCGHFKKANDYLASNGRQTIDWTQL